MTCAKVVVIATLTCLDGSVFTGTNACRNPQTVCPRRPGEGYEKCKSVCDQPYHAELAAVLAAGPERAMGGKMDVQYEHICDGCKAVGHILDLRMRIVPKE